MNRAKQRVQSWSSCVSLVFKLFNAPRHSGAYLLFAKLLCFPYERSCYKAPAVNRFSICKLSENQSYKKKQTDSDLWFENVRVCVFVFLTDYLSSHSIIVIGTKFIQVKSLICRRENRGHRNIQLPALLAQKLLMKASRWAAVHDLVYLFLEAEKCMMFLSFWFHSWFNLWDQACPKVRPGGKPWPQVCFLTAPGFQFKLH